MAFFNRLLTNSLLKSKVLVMASTECSDQSVAALEAAARAHLTTKRLRDSLPRGPWLGKNQPVEDCTLLRAVSWAATADPGRLDMPSDVLDALTLLGSARRELDQLEAGLLFLVRAEGVSWGSIGAALGLRTPQAAQQRADRVTARLDGPGE